MDSAVLLDLLGNENRRRILRLLSHKPCYVTEISEYLGVSPKAVIDHLRKLEEAGLIESHTDDQRRKYFHISRSLRLEVNVSPYGFGAKSAYPASSSLDMSGRCPHLSIDTTPNGNSDSLSELANEFSELQSLENELSLAQRWVHGRITDLLDRLNDQLGTNSDSRFYAEVLAAIDGTDGRTDAITQQVNAPAHVVEGALTRLKELGVITDRANRWEIR
ncbi:ArsR/SmtB family transcription factor [Natronocalculus amylovorans]|uniref:ArsR family transcriptional regulator n=1 Tax=Natronocalculus amylovorans TaxID=2917812 RepID=A0AAE3K8D1_9EURY|nr:ArsR family transcriptional regulator [Natronocalculus amylovorans]MCL9816385.1 ArsR family transcriptional regulator [Natronocalculus amylovorans]NUE03477.1 ArsR family transcriptional regulator [Halorubraceae archaeon YAN]